MAIFGVPRQRTEAEWIDTDEWPDSDFAESFADVARVNRRLGGIDAVLRSLRPMAADLPPGDDPIRILDLATGSADIPREIVRTARNGAFGGRKVEIVAVDNHPRVLPLARRLSEGYPEITIEEADVYALPYLADSFDFVLCSLAFHHFGSDGCVAVLQEMDRIARAGAIVNDLIRDRLACGLIWTLTRVLRANRLTRHDGPLSVLRAYTIEEYVDLARRAGIEEYRVLRRPFYRAVIEWRCTTAPMRMPQDTLGQDDGNNRDIDS